MVVCRRMFTVTCRLNLGPILLLVFVYTIGKWLVLPLPL